jgi:hypothetical protein
MAFTDRTDATFSIGSPRLPRFSVFLAPTALRTPIDDMCIKPKVARKSIPIHKVNLLQNKIILIHCANSTTLVQDHYDFGSRSASKRVAFGAVIGSNY